MQIEARCKVCVLGSSTRAGERDGPGAQIPYAIPALAPDAGLALARAALASPGPNNRACLRRALGEKAAP